MFVSSLQYLKTSFHLHRFLKSTVEKKIKIMFSFQCLSCVCLLGFTHTFPAPYYLVWYFSKQALVQVSPFTKSKKLYIMVKIIFPARGCLSIDLEYSHLDFWLSCGKKISTTMYVRFNSSFTFSFQASVLSDDRQRHFRSPTWPLA